MKDLSSASGRMEEQRNEKGQWLAGVSGNPSGRPSKKAALPKSLTGHLADAMMEKIPLINADGKQEMVPAHEAVVRQLVRSLPSLKTKELITAIRWMDGLHVYDEMRKRAGDWPDDLTHEQALERVTARLQQLREGQRTLDL